MSKPKFHKLYFPGLISLVLLPVMCICYLVSNNIFHKYQAMRVIWTTKEKINREVSRPGKKFNIETFRRYRVLNLTGNAKNDAVVLDSLKILLERLSVKNDTINGVNVSFSNSTQYYELVDALDICSQADKDEQLAFAPMTNRILIAHLSPVKYNKVPAIDCLLCNDVIYSQPDQSIFSTEAIKGAFIGAYKILIGFWPSALAFILMIYFSINKRKRYFYIHKPQE